MTESTTTPPAFLRAAKLKTWGAIRRSAGHTWRTDPVPHADPARRHLNEDWRPVSDPESLRVAIEERLATLTKAPTWDAVLCVEYLVTARREAFAEHGGATSHVAYFRDALAFLERRHGAANVVAVNVQRDEVAPHLVVYVVPIVERPARMVRRCVFAPGRDAEGRQRREMREFPAPAEVALSADHYNGTPEKLAALQTAFAEEVAERHGLERGLEMSAATHTTNREHHAALARAVANHLAIRPEELERRGPIWNRESTEDAARRLSDLIRGHYAPTVASAATAEHDRRRARDMVETARRHRARYRREQEAHTETRAELARLTEGLTPEQRQHLERQAAQLRSDNDRARREALARQEAEKAARQRKAEEQERQAAERARQREERLAARLRRACPEDFARAPEALRVECWRLMLRRDDLEPASERMIESGLFGPAGHLSAAGRALVEQQAESRRRVTAWEVPAPDNDSAEAFAEILNGNIGTPGPGL